jgi:hypothetical protein
MRSFQTNDLCLYYLLTFTSRGSTRYTTFGMASEHLLRNIFSASQCLTIAPHKHSLLLGGGIGFLDTLLSKNFFHFIIQNDSLIDASVTMCVDAIGSVFD